MLDIIFIILITIIFASLIFDFVCLGYDIFNPIWDEKFRNKEVRLKRIGDDTITTTLNKPLKHGTTEMIHCYTYFQDIKTNKIYAYDGYDVQNNTVNGQYYNGIVYTYLFRHHILMEVYR